MWVVLLMPLVPRLQGKTQQLYARLKAAHFSAGQITDRMVSQLTGGEKINPAMLFNVFDEIAPGFFAGLVAYRQRFLKAGASEVYLAGSGPVLFILLDNGTQAEKIYENLQEQGLESYLVETLTYI
jgi:4-diphosphocytidyl-2-C-methyl-D-erythritol kinase